MTSDGMEQDRDFMNVTAFLKSPQQQATGPMVVLHGANRYLRQTAFEAVCANVFSQTDDADTEFSTTRLTGKDAELKTVLDELRTVSMWGGQRLVAVDDADEFVTKNRAGLEKYLEHPAKAAVLVLLLKTWRKNTRLAKRLAKIGLDVECKDLSGRELVRWLAGSCQEQHGCRLPQDAARLLIELSGTELGSLEQELEKLAAYVLPRKQIDSDDVRLLVGGWKAETTFAMTGAVRDGDLGAAVEHLDKLLAAGEAPQRILGGLNFVFRRLAKATEAARSGIPLRAALKQAGVFPNEIDSSSRYLRRIGRPRAEKLFRILLTADEQMKGGSRIAEQLQLESLLVQLSGRLPDE